MLEWIHQLIPRRTINSLDIEEVTAEDVKDIFLSLKLGKAAGHHRITVLVIIC